MKILEQDCWIEKLPWDAPLQGDKLNTVQCWLDDLKIMKHFEVPRCYVSNGLWSENGVELHIFADASKRVYSCCIYIVSRVDNTLKSSLVFARARVAPIEELSLPRLELMGCLLAARCLYVVQNALKLTCKYFCYTDSNIALCWIQGRPSKWKRFVASRVKEIQKLTAISSWTHVSSEDNIADIMTRGARASRLMTSQWLVGPNFIRLEAERKEQPKISTETTELVSCEESQLLVDSSPCARIIDIDLVN